MSETWELLSTRQHPLFFHALFLYTGFMRNEFQGTTGWGCPCLDPNNCDTECVFSGQQVLNYYAVLDINKVRMKKVPKLQNCFESCWFATAQDSWRQPAYKGAYPASHPPLAVQWVCLAILAAWAVFYRILFFLALKYKEARSK